MTLPRPEREFQSIHEPAANGSEWERIPEDIVFDRPLQAVL